MTFRSVPGFRGGVEVISAVSRRLRAKGSPSGGGGLQQLPLGSPMGLSAWLMVLLGTGVAGRMRRGHPHIMGYLCHPPHPTHHKLERCPSTPTRVDVRAPRPIFS